MTGAGWAQDDITSEFPLGLVVCTPGVIEHWGTIAPLTLLHRHAQCDWDEMDPEDRALNRQAITNGTRILSAYTITGVPGDTRVFVITEADRSVTTILLGSEY